jgi:hypothetical protein
MSILRHIPYAVLSAGLLAAGGASAQSMGSIDAREANQQERIEQGRRDGSLTRSEAYRLEQGEQRIDRYEAHARADGVVTPAERQRLDNMLDREGHSIYRESHDGQRADGRGTGGHDGWGHDRDRSDHGQHEGWTRGEHNGWDGNRPPGVERRDARDDRRIQNGVRDGSLTRGEANRLEHGQNRIDRYEARARSDGVVTPSERNRIDNMQNRESRQIYADRHNDRTTTMPTSGTQPTTGSQPANGSHNWSNAGWRQPQAGNTTPTTGTQPSTGSRNWSGFRTQQAAATPTATPRPTMTRASAPSTGARSWGGRH